MKGDSTRWTVIRRAADGEPQARAEFARRYGPVIRAYLVARWRKTFLAREVDDAKQQVFVDCFKEDGALGRADPDRGEFRGFLYGVVRNVALMVERRHARARERQPHSDHDLETVASRDDSASAVFDRAWAATILRDAAALQLERAREAGPDALRRHRLLALRFGEGLPVREIAARWDVEAKVLYREVQKAREEFRQALMDVLRELHGGGPEAVERECDRLRQYFS